MRPSAFLSQMTQEEHGGQHQHDDDENGEKGHLGSLENGAGVESGNLGPLLAAPAAHASHTGSVSVAVTMSCASV